MNQCPSPAPAPAPAPLTDSPSFSRCLPPRAYLSAEEEICGNMAAASWRPWSPELCRSHRRPVQALRPHAVPPPRHPPRFVVFIFSNYCFPLFCAEGVSLGRSCDAGRAARGAGRGLTTCVGRWVSPGLGEPAWSLGWSLELGACHRAPNYSELPCGGDASRSFRQEKRTPGIRVGAATTTDPAPSPPRPLAQRRAHQKAAPPGTS